MSLPNLFMEWGQRLLLVTGIATPLYGGLAYYKLTPVTESFVSAQVDGVRKEVALGRAETLDTKRAVLGLARSDLIRERDALHGALKTEKNDASRLTFTRRLETITAELDRIDRASARIETRIEEIQNR